jgi:O-antigen ligase
VLKAYAGGHTSQARSTEGRLAIWKRSAEVFKQSPLWGVGSGNAPLFLTSSADQEETTGFASRTFSLPVQLLTEKGVIGTAVYLAVLVLAGLAAHRKLRSPKVSLQMKGLTCCLLAGVIAVLFRELTYSSLLEHAATAMLFAMSLALLAGEEPA